MKPMECYPTLTQCIQDDYNWDYVKRVANSVYLTIVNPAAKLKFGIHDPTQKFYENNLPKMLKDVLLEALLYPELVCEHHVLVLKYAYNELNIQGFIGDYLNNEKFKNYLLENLSQTNDK